MAKLTQQVMRTLLEYNQETGILVWRTRQQQWFKSVANCTAWNKQNAGHIAFTNPLSGYLSGRIFNRPYLAHRVIWLWMVGRWPDQEIDHINRVRNDNRWFNLREVTRAENARNLSTRADNSSGAHGVMWDARRGRWRAYINIDYRQMYLGRFRTREEALTARQTAERSYGFTQS